MQQTTPITKKGKEKLAEELKQLKSVERPKIIEAIADARAQGDLSENAEYSSARERQGFIEGRIKELEYKLSIFTVIDPTTLSGDKIYFGATVTVANIEDEKEVVYQIVGNDEADIEQGLISVSSPIAKGLMGKEEGEIIDIQTPKGKQSFEIIEVNYI